jgi:hypothetical protein
MGDKGGYRIMFEYVPDNFETPFVFDTPSVSFEELEPFLFFTFVLLVLGIPVYFIS